MKASSAKFNLEESLWKLGISTIAGIDEVGRGAWAGPVVAAAVVFHPFCKIDFKLYDSKLLSPKKREEIAEKIIKIAAGVGYGVVGLPTINKKGIGFATQKAFKLSVNNLNIQPEYFLIDAFYIKHWSRENQNAIKRGDQICASIAAASIVAKVFRDSLMRDLDKKYPKYGFSAHKGYGTHFHQKAIRKNKLSAVHRKSFNLSFLLT